MWVTKEQIEKAKEMDLLTYLQNYEPQNLKKICNGTYTTKEHDSLKISNGMWHWFSRHIGGKNALDYLIKVKGISLPKAVEIIVGCAEVLPPVYSKTLSEKDTKILELPKFCKDISIVRQYLKDRGINDSVIDFCFENKMLYEDVKYHNCVFLGYDRDTPKYGALRSTKTDFKRDLTGSDKTFSFCIKADDASDGVRLFEAAIDLLSYASLEVKNNRNWRKDNLLSLAGVYKTDNKQDIPLALKAYLERNPNTKTIYLHLDNDEVGIVATRQIVNALKAKYAVIDCPPKSGKDYNDYLQNELRKEKRREYER